MHQKKEFFVFFRIKIIILWIIFFSPLQQPSVPDNLFINYLSRIHRDEDFQFVLKGFARLLNNPLMQTYLPNSTKKVQFHQELLVFFWKMCDYNKVQNCSQNIAFIKMCLAVVSKPRILEVLCLFQKFLYYVLKGDDVLHILVPILFHLNDSRADQCKFCEQNLSAA